MILKRLLRVSDGEQIALGAFNQVSFHISDTLLLVNNIRSLINRDFVFEDASGLFVQASFSSFAVMPS